jgi:RNA polymerase sigma-70 factor (ECF subfamily)
MPTATHPRTAGGYAALLGISDDADLLRRLRRGDRAAYAALYTATCAALTRYAATRLPHRDRDAAPDLVHDAFCDALLDPDLLGPDLYRSLLRLVARAATRHCWSQRRYARAAYTICDSMRTPTGPVLVARTVAVTSRPGFGPAFGALTDAQREAIRLRYLDGYPLDRVAQVMGRSIPAVRDLERRALRRLHAACTA